MASENPTTTKTVDERSVMRPTEDFVDDLKSEAKREVSEMEGTGDLVNPAQSDVLVQKHVTGLAISFFILIVIALLAAIGGIFLYTRTHP